jgi:hypothetical protein
VYNNRKIGISIRFYPDLMQTIDELAHLEFEGNVTETIISLVDDGLKLRKLQKTIQDNPEKSDEIIKELNEKIENESVYDWLNNLTDRQKKGIVEYIQTTTD